MESSVKAKKVSIQINPDLYLVAERNYDTEFKEIFIGMEDGNGCRIQDLVMAGEEYDWNSDTGKPVGIGAITYPRITLQSLQESRFMKKKLLARVPI